MNTIKPTLNLTSQHIYTFAAASGVQHKIYYNINVPFRVMVKLLRIDDAGSTMDRSQRTVNDKRAKGVCDYIVENVKKGTPFIIPTVTGFIDSERAAGDARFVSAAEQCDLDNKIMGFHSVGLLVVGMDAEFKLFDGQHRSRGVALALEQVWQNRHQPEYENIDIQALTVPVMTYLDLTLEERQMFFSDINMNMAKPQAAIGIAYDHRCKLSRFVATEIAQELPFKGLVELERNTIAKKSDKLFSLKTLKDIAQSIMGLGNRFTNEDITEDRKQFVRDVLTQFSRPMGWSALEFAGNDAAELRDSSIITHTVMMKAVAEAAKTLDAQFPGFKGCDLNKLSGLDYGRNAGDFIGRCIDPFSMTMRMNQTGIKLAANKLVVAAGGKLAPDSKALEKQYFPEFKEAPQTEKPTVHEKNEGLTRNEILNPQARIMVMDAAGFEEKKPAVVTRVAGGVVKAMIDYENKHGLSLVPVVDIMKEHVRKVNDVEGTEASWNLVKTPKAAVKLIECALKKVGMIC